MQRLLIEDVSYIVVRIIKNFPVCKEGELANLNMYILKHPISGQLKVVVK
jgi:hypothetical protein